jgi:hypothetical protein
MTVEVRALGVLCNLSCEYRPRMFLIVGDRELIREFRPYLGAERVAIVDVLSLRELAAVLETSTLFLGNDSGPSISQRRSTFPLCHFQYRRRRRMGRVGPANVVLRAPEEM